MNQQYSHTKLRYLVKVLLVIGCLGFIPGCFLVESLWEDRRSNVEDFIGIKIPETASNVTYDRETWLDANFAALGFDLLPGDFEHFLPKLEALCPDGFLQNGFNPFYIDSDDWTPMQAKVFQGDDCQTEHLRYRILVDQTDPASYRIYIDAAR